MSDASKPIIPFLAALYSPLQCLAYPLIRLFAGLMLVPHGAQKLFGAFGGGGLERTAGFLGNVVTFIPGNVSALLVGGTEFFGGMLIAVGLLTRPAALMAAVVLWIATFSVHMQNGFFVGGGGYEFVMLWAVLMTAITLRGGGTVSIDRAIGREF